MVLTGVYIALGLISLVFLRSIFHYYVTGSYFDPNPLQFQLNVKHVRILEKHFRFYQQLPHQDRKHFDRRLVKFIRSKTFIPRSMSRVTAEMKVCIAATAVQLTKGLPDVYLSHFKYILIYPDEYYSTITRRYHKGEVNPGHKAIVLSWRAYVEGYAHNEGINLGLHEMAHALHLENLVRNKEFDFLPKDDLQKWDEQAREEIEKIKTEKNTFFRAYGAVDSYEFFAVAVENFFERPEAFYHYNSELYMTLSNVLNQDPLKRIS